MNVPTVLAHVLRLLLFILQHVPLFLFCVIVVSTTLGRQDRGLSVHCFKDLESVERRSLVDIAYHYSVY
jgi:membrane protein required for beta-lactamase induction